MWMADKKSGQTETYEKRRQTREREREYNRTDRIQDVISKAERSITHQSSNGAMTHTCAKQ